MPDKKLTDSEIVKALECCKSNQGCGGCFFKKEEYCINVLKNLALDLINRQNAKIDTLQKQVRVIGRQVERAKAEAYKEFAELLHCQCESIINQPHNENVRPISWKVAYEEFDEKIDDLLKEMVGK